MGGPTGLRIDNPIFMNTGGIAFLAGLVLTCGPALDAQTSVAGPAVPGIAAEVLAQLALPSGVLPGAQSGAVTGQDTVVKLAPFRILSGHYPRFVEIAEASAQTGLLEPCALVKTNLNAKRRYDYFLAPVALDNGAAGFGIARISW